MKNKPVFIRFKTLLFYPFLPLLISCENNLTVKGDIIEPEFYWSDQMGGGCSYRFTDKAREIMQTIVYLTDKIGVKEYTICDMNVHSFTDYFVVNCILCEKKEKLILKFEI